MFGLESILGSLLAAFQELLVGGILSFITGLFAQIFPTA